MIISKPTYLIAELEGEVSDFVLDLRKKFNKERVAWPVDITIAGSSGLGTLTEGQELQGIIELLTPTMMKYGFADVMFKRVACFPNTGIYYLEPERGEFDALHEAID